jgi:CheY-like chemotaxis protein
MSGLQLMEEFQKHKKFNVENNATNLNEKVLFIGMSATASNEEQQQGFNFGMDLYCQKPVDTNVLNCIVTTLNTHIINEVLLSKLVYLNNLYDKFANSDKIVFSNFYSKKPLYKNSFLKMQNIQKHSFSNDFRHNSCQLFEWLCRPSRF